MEEMKYYCKFVFEISKNVTLPWTPRHERDNNGEWVLNKEDVRM
jgi:hypothetical protein